MRGGSPPAPASRAPRFGVVCSRMLGGTAPRQGERIRTIQQANTSYEQGFKTCSPPFDTCQGSDFVCRGHLHCSANRVCESIQETGVQSALLRCPSSFCCLLAPGSPSTSEHNQHKPMLSLSFTKPTVEGLWRVCVPDMLLLCLFLSFCRA